MEVLEFSLPLPLRLIGPPSGLSGWTRQAWPSWRSPASQSQTTFQPTVPSGKWIPTLPILSKCKSSQCWHEEKVANWQTLFWTGALHVNNICQKLTSPLKTLLSRAIRCQQVHKSNYSKDIKRPFFSKSCIRNQKVYGPKTRGSCQNMTSLLRSIVQDSNNKCRKKAADQHKIKRQFSACFASSETRKSMHSQQIGQHVDLANTWPNAYYNFTRIVPVCQLYSSL